MSKNKHRRFAENATFPHLFQPSYEELTAEKFPVKGNWEAFFGNGNPIVLELGCGRGEYTVALASKYPDVNFIGIDVKGARLWRGAKTVREKQIGNAAFLRMRIDTLLHAFAPQEVSGLWITFPDPQPGKARKRLTSPLFTERYRRILKPGGVIHLKTDNAQFFEYTLEEIKANGHHLLLSTSDLYATDWEDDAKLTQTYYENMFSAQGIPIKYLRFTLNEGSNER